MSCTFKKVAKSRSGEMVFDGHVVNYFFIGNNKFYHFIFGTFDLENDKAQLEKSLKTLRFFK